MRKVDELIGVYDANAGLVGELSYFVKARLGAAHCALCDVTHGKVRERADWRECRGQLAAPFVTYHRNDQPSALRLTTRDAAPVVAARVDQDYVVVLTAEEIAACDGAPDRLVEAIRAGARRQHLAV